MVVGMGISKPHAAVIIIIMIREKIVKTKFRRERQAMYKQRERDVL